MCKKHRHHKQCFTYMMVHQIKYTQRNETSRIRILCSITTGAAPDGQHIAAAKMMMRKIQATSKKRTGIYIYIYCVLLICAAVIKDSLGTGVRQHHDTTVVCPMYKSTGHVLKGRVVATQCAMRECI